MIAKIVFVKIVGVELLVLGTISSGWLIEPASTPAMSGHNFWIQKLVLMGRQDILQLLDCWPRYLM